MDVGTAFVNAEIDNDRTFFSLPDGYKQHAQVDGKRMCLKAKRHCTGYHSPHAYGTANLQPG